MFFNIIYPAMLKADSPTGRQWVRTHLEGAFEIEEADESALPLAFAFTPEGDRNPLTYRVSEEDEGFFRGIGPVEKALARPRESKSSPGQPDWSSAVRRLHPSFDHCDRITKELWATKEDFVWHPADGDRPALLRGVSATGLREAEDAFRDTLSDYRLVKGVLYRRTPEPVFSVYRNNTSWKTVLSWGRANVTSESAFHFPVTEFDRMTAFKRMMAEREGCRATDDIFEHSIPFKSKIDAFRTDVDSIVRLTAYKFVRWVSEVVEGGRIRHKTDGLRDLPLPLLENYVELRRFMEAAPESKSLDDYDRIVTLMEELPLLAAQNGIHHGFKPGKSERLHFEKWRYRRSDDIDLSPLLGLAP